MANYLDYVKTNQQSFKEKPLTEVDSLIFSCLSYFHFTHLTFKTKIKNLNPTLDLIIQKNKRGISLLKEVIKSKRFNEVEIIFSHEDTSEKEDKQFAATTFLLPNNEMYIAFRGTDATLIGWEEDFNMAFMLPVPSQEEALKYTNKIISIIPRKFYLGGHSKGGNLSVYTASMLQDTTNLIKVYSHDGPGFLKEFLTSSNYLKITPKLEKTVPSSSIIGMLLYANEHYKIIKSSNKGLLEHDPNSWLVVDDHFYTLKKLDDGTTYTNKIINDFINTLTKEERLNFIESLFKILKSTNLTTLDEIAKSRYYKLPIMLKTLNKFDKKEKSYLYKTLKVLIITILKNSI